MPVTTGHSSESLKLCQYNDNISVNETTRAAATPHIDSVAKPMKYVPSQIRIQDG